MVKADLTKEQQEEINEYIKKGVAFEGMVSSDGWQYIKAYYELKLKQFVSMVFSKDQEPLQSFEKERSELIGLKKLMTEIDFAIKKLNDEREKIK